MSLGPVGEWLLGFDARELWLDVGSQWDASRRALYLLREDVKKPLSLSERRVPEHAPFFVFGLWLVGLHGRGHAVGPWQGL